MSLNRTAKIVHTKLDIYVFITNIKGRAGRGRMVVAFTTTYPISAYHH